MKIIEESNTFQNKILGLTDHQIIATSIMKEYEFEIKAIIEREKIEFRMIVIDETALSVKYQHTCSECRIEKAVAKTVRDTKTLAFQI